MYFFKIFQTEVAKGKENDFVECLVYSDKKAVVMTGNMVNTCKPNQVNEIVSQLFETFKTFFEICY